MTIEDRVNHLANLTFLLDFHEKLGGTRNKWVLAEFAKLNEELITELKEKHDETRRSPSHQQRPQEGTDLSRG